MSNDVYAGELNLLLDSHLNISLSTKEKKPAEVEQSFFLLKQKGVCFQGYKYLCFAEFSVELQELQDGNGMGTVPLLGQMAE